MSNPDNFKTKMCNNWQHGKCNFGSKCHFAHGESELREINPKKCWFFSQGICKNGRNCTYLHDCMVEPISNVSPKMPPLVPWTPSCWDTPSPSIKNPFAFSPSPFRVENQTQPQAPKKRNGPLFPIKNWVEAVENEDQHLSDEDIDDFYSFYLSFDTMMKKYANAQNRDLINALNK